MAKDPDQPGVFAIPLSIALIRQGKITKEISVGDVPVGHIVVSSAVIVKTVHFVNVENV